MSNRNFRPRRGRVSGRQLDILWELLNSHRDIATGHNRSLQAKEYSKRKWREFAESLNAQGEGAHKEWNEWSKYWVDYKAKLKKRVSELRTAKTTTGGGSSSESPLSDIDKKFLQILGEDFGQGLRGVRVEPFPDLSSTAVSVVESAIELDVSSPAAEFEHSRSVAAGTVPVGSPFEEPFPEPAPAPAATARSPRHRRQQRRREPPMSQEAARRALVEYSRVRAEATVRSSHALENIGNILERLERFIYGVFARAAE